MTPPLDVRHDPRRERFAAPLGCRTPVVALALGAAACGGDGGAAPGATPTPAPGPSSLTTALVVSGLSRPLDLQAPPGDPRLFIVEQGGRIRIVRDGALLAQPFLDLTDRVLSGGERGLLGLAFHPDYAGNGRFFVNYTDGAGDTRISEFRVNGGDPDRADPASERLLLGVAQPFPNHNGGGLVFGPDGFLYAALGDGGSGGDPMDLAQDLSTPLGKLHRLDVDGSDPFGIPPDNPFLAAPGALASIWAYGLRNPWRFAFDPATGDLFVGDVGQDRVEEIDAVPAGSGAGRNYGWNVMEGSLCFEPSSGCSAEGLTLPVVEYDHSEGCSVTGGVVYRGERFPDLAGSYFYGDFCSAFVRSFRFEGGQAVDHRDWTQAFNPDGRISGVAAFGTDAAGEVYILDLDGRVFGIVPPE